MYFFIFQTKHFASLQYISLFLCGFCCRWTGQQPIVFQCWNNIFDTKRDTTQFDVYHSDGEEGCETNTGACYLSSQSKLLKNLSTTNMYPTTHRQRTCTILLVSNLAYPQWVPVKCSQKLLHTVICFKCSVSEPNQTAAQPAVVCSNLTILRQMTCHKLLWVDGAETEGTCHSKKLKLRPASDMRFRKNFSHLIGSVIGNVSLLFENNSKTLTLFSYLKLWTTFRLNWTFVDWTDATGHLVCRYNPEQNQPLYSSTFMCLEGYLISDLSVCDGIHDCFKADRKSSGEDEAGCRCKNFNGNCKNVCGDSVCVCSPLYYISRKKTCEKYSAQLGSGKDSKMQMPWFQCFDNKTIHHSLLDDLLPDCLNGEDEELLHKLHLGETQRQCPVPGEVPCLPGHLRCYKMTDVCVFKLNSFELLYPCRTGAHLQECSAFECHQHYKCPGHYCVPFGYVCDGKWDCPDAYDEKTFHKCGSSRLCENMFKCKHSQICIHLFDMCDGVHDCPLKEDETMCELQNIACPDLCICLVFGLVCKAKPTSYMSLLKISFQAYFLVSLNVTSLPVITENINLLLMNLSHNRITQLDQSFSNFPQLTILDFSFNLLTELSENRFVDLPKLAQILFKHNKLTKMKSKTFINITNLVLVHLAANELVTLPEDVFVNVSLIHILNLENNKLDKLKSKIVLLVNLEVLVTSIFGQCCVALSNYKCLTDWYQRTSSCQLLPGEALNSVLTFVSLGIILLNSLSLLNKFSKIKKKMEGSTFGVLVFALNSGDCLCAFYLLIIWAGNMYFSTEFALNESSWRSGVPCHTAFLVLLFFQLLMPCLLSLTSFARFMVVLYPLRSKFKFIGFVKSVVAKASFCLLLTAVAAHSSFAFLTSYRIPSNLCSALIDSTHNFIGVIILTWTIALTQTLACAFICVCHTLLRNSLNKSSNEVHIESKHYFLKIQLAVLSLSNFACWVPSNTLFLMALFHDKVSTEMLLWATATAMPLNSMINPVMFTFVPSCKRFVSNCFHRHPNPAKSHLVSNRD